jgi:predicted DNA-binding protein (MmcQ/YjbR family)
LSDPVPTLSGMVRGRPEPDPRLVARVAEIALRLPAAHEQDAWTGVRWRVRQRTFAHVVALHHVDAVERLGISDGRTVTVVTLRSTGEERAALAAIGPPFLASWSDDVVAVVLDADTDWTELAELVAESYRLLAPARLVRELDAPG